ncbi:hypothetical protein O5621_03775 [Escherichia coli]|nr:hypothetical protein [Escherichia coli]
MWGSSAYFLKTPGKIEANNDINGELANLYCGKALWKNLSASSKWALVSRQIYKWLQIYPGRNTDGYPACGTVLLPSEAGVWRQGGRAQLRYSHHIPATLQPRCVLKKNCHGTPAAFQNSHRTHGLATVH